MKLVMIHGAGASSLSFYYQLRHFRNSKAIDLPGHPTGKACESIDLYVDWVRGFNTARRYKDVVLCGHSMGGAIALQYALRYPDELKAIILIGTGAKLKVDPKLLKECEEAEDDRSEWLESHKELYKDVEDDINQVLMRRTMEIGPQVELNDLIACDQFDVMNKVHKVELPTHVMCGSEDSATPVKFTEYLAANIPGAQHQIIEGGRHFVQLEKYQRVNDQIERFISTLK
jgi:pimeloyl-ACP methyl ester carboxylesterase